VSVPGMSFNDLSLLFITFVMALKVSTIKGSFEPVVTGLTGADRASIVHSLTQGRPILKE